MAKKYYQTFVVETGFQFPIDMLRYDGCFPDTEHDSVLIILSLADMRNPVKVKIGRYVSIKRNKPTISRWESFGCKISEIEIR